MKIRYALAVLLLASSGAAMADQDHGRGDRGTGFRWGDRSSLVPIKAPEIDPASIVAGLTLLGGGLAVLRGRRSK